METKIENLEELAKELNYSELEDRLEMANAAAGDVARCGAGIEQAR